MPLPIDIQFNIIMYSFLAGLLTGAMFDLYRIIRGKNVPKLIIVVEDVLFSILAAIIVFTFLLYTDYAFLGPYVYFFIISALAIYIKIISPIFIKVEIAFIDGISTIIRVLLKNFIYPIKIILYNITGKK